MPSDNDSYQPSSSGSDGSSDERELQTLDELQKKVIADGEEESSGETESSGPDDKSHSDSSSEKAPPPRKTKAVNQTPKKNTPRRQSSSLDRGSGSKKKTTKKKVIEESRESSEDDSSSSSRPPKTPQKRKPQKQAGKKKWKKAATVNTTGKGKKAGSTTFTPDELLLLSKAYMRLVVMPNMAPTRRLKSSGMTLLFVMLSLLEKPTTSTKTISTTQTSISCGMQNPYATAGSVVFSPLSRSVASSLRTRLSPARSRMMRLWIATTQG